MADPSPVCPSSVPELVDTVVFGVVGGSVEAPRVSYLAGTIEPSRELLDLADPVAPTEVFRFAGPCVERACQQFHDGRCSIGDRLVSLAEPVVERLPRCAIRSRCRWWAENGRAACLRCPAVVTLNNAPGVQQRGVAGPLGAQAGAQG
jgi:hypothetical protein